MRIEGPLTKIVDRFVIILVSRKEQEKGTVVFI